MALTGVLFYSFVEKLAEKAFDLQNDTLKVALSNTAPDETSDTQLSDITQISNGNGYTTGGEAVTVSSSAQTGGTYKLVITNPTWTASGNMGTFRYLVLYDDTATNDELICYFDIGSGLSLTSSDTYTANFDATNGVIQIA